MDNKKSPSQELEESQQERQRWQHAKYKAKVAAILKLKRTDLNKVDDLTAIAYKRIIEALNILTKNLIKKREKVCTVYQFIT